MVANVITFEQPTLKIYQKLPISRKELDEVLAVLFTGHQPPTEEDLARTPVLVRRERVLAALVWLKKNNIHYADLEIDHETLATYPLAGVPVEVVFRSTATDSGNVLASMKSQFDNDDERGTASGPCPFTVHGLTADNHGQMTTMQRKTAGLQHLKRGGSMLAVGHAEDPESIFGDLDLFYPRMFPWLFPYGLGGLGQARHKGLIKKEKHVQWWLNYHDKRFQQDSNLVIVLLNHHLIRQSSAKSFIMVKRRNFSDIARVIRNIKPAVLNALSERLKEGGRSTPLTDEEQKCYKLLDQIEYVSTNVEGSISKKKHMCNEAWSLVNFRGPPTWFITITPSDHKHPLCLYWASRDVKFRPEIKGYAEREHIVTRNPVACAKFFHYMVKLFIKHICGWTEDGPTRGAFGVPSAYYGTVEQQGRMTLHLHFLLWIEGSLPLHVVRERLMSEDSDFTKALLLYIESCQVGEFSTGSMEDVQNRTAYLETRSNRPSTQSQPDIHDVITTSSVVMNDYASEQSAKAGDLPDVSYIDPTLTLPEAPPSSQCSSGRHFDDGCDCEACREFGLWCKTFWSTTDDIMCRSNTHRCYSKRDNSSKKSNKNLPKQHPTGKGCVNEKGECTARFPRKIVEHSHVDLETGHVNLRKREEWINCVTPLITASSRCNSDTTSLLSGTAVKATLGYVTDYITKSTLKTYQLFSLMYDTYTKHSDVINCDGEPSNGARKMVVKMVNALSSKSEIGAPYAALILLGNPDHYTSHSYVPFYWKGFVNYVLQNWKQLLENADGKYTDPVNVSSNISPSVDPADASHDIDYSNVEENENVTLTNAKGHFMAKSSTDDYRLRPMELSNVCLYEWIQCAVRRNVNSSRTAKSHLTYFPYLPEHPMVGQYLVACDPDQRAIMVPNFIGPPLP
ncbi:hypothetical protein CVT24_000036 [Panaeolus cyanescens]|uniref:Uncharacterized protein n=1 Tax=Panaeolus cyanescens TaxID=181874 RepID=A0A409W7G9_9AGAR|nr:hypothetical protein CVT24_000036 [Panaeolus cyanescens]